MVCGVFGCGCCGCCRCVYDLLGGMVVLWLWVVWGVVVGGWVGVVVCCGGGGGGCGGVGVWGGVGVGVCV